MRQRLILLFLAALMETSRLSALPIIAVDLDPSVGGVQGTLSVPFGSSFGVDIVIIGDGTPFDNATVDTPFNDNGSVLALAGGPLAGTLASSPVLSIDAVGPFTFVSTGDTLAQSSSPPPAGFANGMGGAGLQALGGAYSPIGSFSILSLAFEALATGTSTIDVTGIFGAPPLASMGGDVPLDGIVSGLVTVERGRPIPEPGTLFLLGAGVVVSSIRRRHKAPPRERTATW